MSITGNALKTAEKILSNVPATKAMPTDLSKFRVCFTRGSDYASVAEHVSARTSGEAEMIAFERFDIVVLNKVEKI